MEYFHGLLTEGEKRTINRFIEKDMEQFAKKSGSYRYINGTGISQSKMYENFMLHFREKLSGAYFNSFNFWSIERLFRGF